MRFGRRTRGQPSRFVAAIIANCFPHLTRSSEAQATAKRFGCPYIETSARDKTNVVEMFHATVREIRKYNQEEPNGIGGPTEKRANARSSGGMGGMNMDEGERTAGCCGGKCVVM